MTTPKNVFLIGAGFIGGEVLELLLEAKYSVTVLVRREEHARELKAWGAQCVMGSLSNGDLIKEQTIKHDVVIHTATADDMHSVQSVIAGLKERKAKSQSSIYLHTSGCSQLCDYAEGDKKSDVIYKDDDPAQIDSLSDDAPHRKVDLTIVQARKYLGDGAKIAIILPPVIYGVSTKAQRLSIQLPTLTRFAIKHGFAPHVGQGLPIWNYVHVRDLARAYVLILQWLEGDKSEDIYQNPYFFVESGEEHSWKESAEAIGQALQEAGKLSDPNPAPVPKDLYRDIFGEYTPHVVGANARNRANRLRSLGWIPKEKDTFRSLREEEIPLILQDLGPFMGYSAAVASGK
ncbi:uncharacterized protein A1O9_11565 [Exophiala aquamarina CBS 119918]|uniref:Uncharacterized protein n=1 Tax=Exophiala aquamarina CBS 119918 TaxID=1182545 RepID=A0A072P9W7_9EURO|nr:uncharacterized protein A1O9_11565 [Exophiala aquamarina CBS 119918]KEF52325.1 hypothetical protein A1O9_11565 [Exophiala aquamarina CBS 119918]